MNDPTPNVDPKNKARAILDEADIGSGERSPGQHETEELIRSIPPLPADGKDDAGKADAGKDNAGKADAPPDKRQEPGAA